LQQSLRNLVSNAIKYGAPDTPLRVTLRGEPTGVRLEVTNSGPSIEPSALNEIFDPLKQGAARPEQDDRSSLGLGLFIVRAIALAHGGDVEVHSGGGETTFALRLPRRTQGQPGVAQIGE
jgi:signal transduction histidine kinase